MPTVVRHQKRRVLGWRAQCRGHPPRRRGLSEGHGRACPLLGSVPLGPALRRGERHARRLARIGPETRVKFVNIFQRDTVLGLLLIFGVPKQKVGKRVEPSLVPLARGSSKPHSTARADNLQAPAVETRRVGVVIGHHSHSLDGNTLCPELSLAGMLRILLTPVQCTCVGVNPEVTTVSGTRHLAGNVLACVLPKELPNHRLRNRLNHAGISALRMAVGHNTTAIGVHVESLLEFRSERRN